MFSSERVVIAYVHEKRMGGRGELVLVSRLEWVGVRPMVYSIPRPQREEFRPIYQLHSLKSRVEAYQFR
jgi:hypothetical protein